MAICTYRSDAGGEAEMWPTGKEIVAVLEGTKAEQRKAMADAKAKARLLAKTLGPGWKPKTWWNLGAHYKASFRDMIHVYPSHRRGEPDKWHCMIGRDTGMLAMLAPDVPYYSDPRRCVRATVKGYARKLGEFNAQQARLLEAGLEAVPLKPPKPRKAKATP